MADATAAKLRQEFGNEVIRLPGEKIDMTVEALSTGCPPLDIAIGIGGIPKGRLTEIFGPESSGKTTLAWHLIAECQKAGGKAMMIDMEHSADLSYAEAIGVCTDDLYFSQPDYGEQALQIVHSYAKTGELDLIVVDSVAALTPKAEIEGAIGDQAVGLHARMMSKAVRMIDPAAEKSGTTVVFINQIREKIGVMFGSPEVQPGGRALKFFSSVRIDIRRKETVGSGNESTANTVKVKLVKNKVGKPYREVFFDIVFGEGIDKTGCILDMTTDPDAHGYVDGIIQRSGRYYTFPDEHKAGSKEEARRYLAANPKLTQSIYNQLVESQVSRQSKPAK